MYQGLNFDQAPAAKIPYRFFLTASVYLLLFYISVLIASLGQSDVSKLIYRPEFIGVLHLLTLGFFLMVFAGSLYQMIPVVLGRKIPWVKQAGVIHFSLLGGLSCWCLSLLFPACGGWLCIGPAEQYKDYLGWVHVATRFLGIGLLGLGVTGLVVQLAGAVLSFRSSLATIWGVQISVFFLCLLFTSGISLALAFTGVIPVYWNRLDLRIAHIIWALAGCMGSLIMGIALHVLPMFYLAPPIKAHKAKILLLLWGLILFLFSIYQALILMGVSFPSQGYRFFLAALALVAGVWAIGLWKNQKKAKRKQIDTPYKYFITGFVLLFSSCLTSILLLLPYPWVSVLEYYRVAFFVSFILSIMTGMLYKIVPFLVWLHNYSNWVGFKQVPSTRQIGPDNRANRQYQLFIAGWVLFVVGSPWHFFLPGALFLTFSALYLFLDLVRMIRYPKNHPPKDF